MKKVNYFSYCLLIAFVITTIVFNSYGQSSTSDEGVVINGVKWATRNVGSPGTFADKPENPGMFYLWNSKIGWSATDPMINSDGGKIWGSSAPGGDTWEKVNDPIPEGWRMPTLEEIKKLLDTDKVDSRDLWEGVYGIAGTQFTDRTSGNSIFLPAAGYRNYEEGGSLISAGLYGLYWSSTLIGYNHTYYLYCGSGNLDWSYWNYDDGAISIRAVAEAGTNLATNIISYNPTTSTSDEGVIINGVKWATRNVGSPGTFADKSEDPGMFYQWNRKIGWSATDPMINSNGSTTWDITFSKETEWEKINDPSPAGWRVPTSDEIETLSYAEYVDNEWVTTENGITGIKFTDKTSGNSIFLPAAGYRLDISNGALEGKGSDGNYWSRTAIDDRDNGDDAAYGLGFVSNYWDWHYWNRRGSGQLIRAVAE